MSNTPEHPSPRRLRPPVIGGVAATIGVGLIVVAAVAAGSGTTSSPPGTRPSSGPPGLEAEQQTTATSTSAPLGDDPSTTAIDGLDAGDTAGAATPASAPADPSAVSSAKDGDAPDDELDDDELDDDEIGLPEEFVVDFVGEITPSEHAEPGDPDPVPLEPVEGGAPECGALLPGRSIVAHPSPLVLDPGVMDGAITVVNCGSEATSFATSGPEYVGWGGSPQLLPGESFDLGFQIDDSSFGAGAIEFELVFTEPGGPPTPVDVYAWKPNMPDLMPQVADVPLSAGDEVTGCGSQCIVEARITRHALTADVTLGMKTHTEAALEVFLRPEPQPGDPILAISTDRSSSTMRS